MRQELLTLSAELMRKRKWAQSTLEKAYGSPGVIDRLQKPKGPTIGTCESFKTWLEAQLKRSAKG